MPSFRDQKASGTTAAVWRFIEWLLDFRLAFGGKLMLAGWAATTLIGMNSLDMPVYLLVCAWTAVGVMAFAMGWLLRPRVILTGEWPDRVSAGQPFLIPCHVTNVTRRPIYDLGAGFFTLPKSLRGEVSAIEPRLEPGGSRTVPVTVEPLKRGFYPMPPLRAYSTFPFHLYRTPAAKVAPPPLLVLPAFTPVSSIEIPLGRRYQPGGIALTSNVGESPEYIGSREYRPGDPTRFIDFRSWARLAKPVVREYQEEYYCRLALVVDTFIPGRKKPGPDGFPALEAAISLSAAVADAVARGEYILDIFAAGPELYIFRAGRHTAHFENVLEVLACVDACRHDPFETVAPALADELGGISTVICVLLDWDKSRELLVRTAAEAGCSLKLLVVRDGDTTLPLSGAEVWTSDIACYTLDAVRAGGIETL